MKNKINEGNYEEVMFGLLEHQYSDEEKEDILFEIERDPLLQFEWKQFQKCILTEDIKPYEIQEVEFWKSLHKKEEGPVMVKRYYFNDIFGIAASVLLIISFALMLYFHRDSKSVKPENYVSVPSTTAKATESSINQEPKDIAPVKTKLKHPAQRLRPVIISENIDVKNTLEEPIIPEPTILPEKAPDEPGKIATVNKQSRYTVKIQTAEPTETELAMMQDYDINDWSKEEENRINTFLKNKQTSIAQLLKNTTIRFKKKDNTIYLLAFGDDQSMFVWEIAK